MVGVEKFRKMKARRNYGFPIGPIRDRNLVDETQYSGKVPLSDIGEKVREVAGHDEVEGSYTQKEPIFDRNTLESGEEIMAAWDKLREELRERREDGEDMRIVCKQSVYIGKGEAYTLIAPLHPNDRQSHAGRVGAAEDFNSFMQRHLGAHEDAYSTLEVVHKTNKPLTDYLESLF